MTIIHVNILEIQNILPFFFADQLKELKDRKKELDAESKALGAEIDRLDLELSDAMAEAECERFSRNGNTFYLNTRLFASPAAGRKEDMICALKNSGMEILTQQNTILRLVQNTRSCSS